MAWRMPETSVSCGRPVRHLRRAREGVPAMKRRCSCGHPIQGPTDALGCIDCGRACCPACAVPLESVAYCGVCAADLLETPGLYVPGPWRQRRYEIATVF